MDRGAWWAQGQTRLERLSTHATLINPVLLLQTEKDLKNFFLNPVFHDSFVNEKTQP